MASEQKYVVLHDQIGSVPPVVRWKGDVVTAEQLAPAGVGKEEIAAQVQRLEGRGAIRKASVHEAHLAKVDVSAKPLNATLEELAKLRARNEYLETENTNLRRELDGVKAIGKVARPVPVRDDAG